MEQGNFFRFSTDVFGDPYGDFGLDFRGAIVARPVEAPLSALRTWVNVVAGTGVLQDHVTIDKFLAYLILAVMLELG